MQKMRLKPRLDGAQVDADAVIETRDVESGS